MPVCATGVLLERSLDGETKARLSACVFYCSRNASFVQIFGKVDFVVVHANTLIVATERKYRSAKTQFRFIAGLIVCGLNWRREANTWNID